MPVASSRDRVCFTGRSLGVVLLLLVNVLWVLSSELTRFIFIDEDFKRPFFTAYVKTCMLTVYIVRYIAFEKSQQFLRVRMGTFVHVLVPSPGYSLVLLEYAVENPNNVDRSLVEVAHAQGRSVA
ncbi:hypothetical protein RB195_006854 [Necator americanus]|uniref:Uncharacterized protein n=1 Tax=Necator americanus TaxID=51031 RepID=A0ABR1BXT3_NECAM